MRFFVTTLTMVACCVVGSVASAQTGLPASSIQAELIVDELEVPRFRKQFYQGVSLTGGYMRDFSNGDQSLHQTFEQVRASFGVPLFSLDNILAVSPYLRIDHLDRSDTSILETPATLYNTGVTLFNRKKWSERVTTIGILTPSVRSDFDNDEDGFRLFGLGVVNWQYSSNFTWTFGAVFLDRADLGLLPVIGATWTPKPWWKVELTLPRPRIARRVWKQAGQAEAWAFVAGSLGGNTWTVSRDDGTVDDLSLRSIELQAGYEVIRAGNRGWSVEAGFAFGRQLEYERTPLKVDLDDAIFFRGGWNF